MGKTRILILVMVLLSCSAYCQTPVLFTNNYDRKSKETVKLYPERSVIYDPAGSWSYAHHPSLAWFKGKLYAVFSNGRHGEDEPGQRIMLSVSENFTDWTEPVALLEPGMGNYGQEKILTPGGITVVDGRLTIYYTENDNDGKSNRRIDPVLYAITSDDGITWSDPVNLSLKIFPCQRPLQLSNGRLLLTGNTLVYYTDDSSGTGVWHRCRMGMPKYQDGAVTFDEVKPSLCEGSLFEHENGTVFCILRSTGKTYDGYLWQMQSNDGGISWSLPVKSMFTDSNSKSYFGSLPDGRYLYVGTPDNRKPADRHPLVLAISENGYDFNRTYILSDDHYSQLYPGRWKGGDYGYPFAIVHDGYVYVIVSRHKERMEILRIGIDELK